MKRTVVALAAGLAVAVALSGCSTTPQGAEEQYEFGDVSIGALDRIDEAQTAYCATANPGRRAVILALIRIRVPEYPASGLCTSAGEALAKEITRRAADLPDGATIDFEQAREDQRRFQEAERESSDSSTTLDGALLRPHPALDSTGAGYGDLSARDDHRGGRWELGRNLYNPSGLHQRPSLRPANYLADHQQCGRPGACLLST